MSKLCKQSWFQYWHHFFYKTLLITHSVHNHYGVIYTVVYYSLCPMC
jgi:hypothetical protein